MAYNKRDFLHPLYTSPRGETVLVKNQGPLVLFLDSDPASFTPDSVSGEFRDLVCDTFYEMQELAESQGVPLLQLCRFPDFLDFVQIIKSGKDLKKLENSFFPIKQNATRARLQ